MNVDGAIPSCAARAAMSWVRTASVTGRFLTEPDWVEAVDGVGAPELVGDVVDAVVELLDYELEHAVMAMAAVATAAPASAVPSAPVHSAPVRPGTIAGSSWRSWSLGSSGRGRHSPGSSRK